VSSALNVHSKTKKLRESGRRCAQWMAQPRARRIGLIAPAVIAIGAVAAWQFSPLDADAAPAAAHRAVSGSVHRKDAAAGRSSRTDAKVTASHGANRKAVTSQHRQTAHAPSATGRTEHSAATVSRRKPAAARVTTFTCHGSGASTSGPLPANYAAIVDFLTAHGYTPLAAAGMAGNMYQESMGNPESVGTGGGGLIGFTPLPAGYVTGNPAADLQTQLQAVLAYNQQWAEYIPMLNAATSPTEAADIYMSDFERPGIPAAANREAAAEAVAQACGIA
jgi:Phage tail lysozyme